MPTTASRLRVALAAVAGVAFALVSTVAVGLLLSAGVVLGLTAISHATREQVRPERLATDDAPGAGIEPHAMPPAEWRGPESWVGDQLGKGVKAHTVAGLPSSHPLGANLQRAPSIGTAVTTLPSGLDTGSLTRNGRLVRNLDGLVRSTFGRRTVCLFLARNELSPSACRQPAHRRTRYAITFADAATSSFRLSDAGTTILLSKDRAPLKIAGKFVACGKKRWLTAGTNWSLACVAGRARHSQSGE